MDSSFGNSRNGSMDCVMSGSSSWSGAVGLDWLASSMLSMRSNVRRGFGRGVVSVGMSAPCPPFLSPFPTGSPNVVAL